MDSSFLQQPTDNPMDYANRVSQMYPDVYKRMMPYIDNAIAALGPNHNLTDDQLNQLTYRVISESNIMSQMPHGHNETTIGDIVKVLLLNDVYQRYHDDPPFFPFVFPFTPFPFFFPFDGFRDRSHGRFHDGFRDGFHGGFRDGFHGGFRR